jgi:lipopolysaccharide/colanic/teichoic acid biosynthesis glycosyltransferase
MEIELIADSMERPTNRVEKNMNHSNAIDARAMRMHQIYAEQRFRSVRGIRRVRLLLAIWIIRIHIAHRLKRVLDIVVASIALILMLPVFVVTTIIIKLETPGPVLFRQTRIGKWGSTFTCYKFRSMYVDAERRMDDLWALNEVDGPVFKMRNDPRITKVGHIIRKLSIDELPQLWNVLRGDMSLVGPRPALPGEVALYTYEQIRRLGAIPGITGLQQVSGRSDLDFKRWIELDVQYITEQSLKKDLEILFKTIPAVFLSKGAY